jgi:hypothetical protein
MATVSTVSWRAISSIQSTARAVCRNFRILDQLLSSMDSQLKNETKTNDNNIKKIQPSLNSDPQDENLPGPHQPPL